MQRRRHGTRIQARSITASLALATTLAATSARAQTSGDSSVATAPAVAQRAAPSADERGRYELRYSVPIDVPITAAAALAWVIPELAKNALTGPTCRFCERNPDGTRSVNGLDTAVRDAFRWSSPNTAATISDVIGYGVAPASAIGLTILVGRLQGGGSERDLWPLWDSLIIAETAALAMDVNQLTKFIALRERPRYQFATDAERAMVVPPGDEILSFFSGHTTFTFALATSAGMVSTMRGYRLAPVVWATGMVLATSAAYLRMAADRHYFTDVLTGMVVGAGMGVLLPWLAHRPLFARGNDVRVSVASVPGGAGLNVRGVW